MSRHGHRFYVPEPLQAGSPVTLSSEQSRQIATVLRLEAGDTVLLFNGDGREYRGAIDDLSVHATRVMIEQCEPGRPELSPPLELALALIKSDRFEWAVQKATELGIARIIPMVTEHSVISLPVGREGRKRERWEKIAVEAAEQSGRTTVPVIDEVVPLSRVVESDARVILLWEDEETVLLPAMSLDVGRPARLVIGPEGGLSAREVEIARRAGAATASLGPLTLRSETAAVAAISMLLARELTGYRSEPCTNSSDQECG